MKRTVLLIILFILLSGCSEIRKAKAYEIRSKARRANDAHRAAMMEQATLAPARITAKKNLILTGAMAGQVLIVVLTASGSFYIIAFAITKVKQANLMLIPLDKTSQYPLVISNGRKSHNPNTLATSDLRRDRLPYPEALRGTQAVQMIGAGGEPRYKSFAEYEERGGQYKLSSG